MRIIGFPKLIKDEESNEHSLQNCSLVIDGQQFFYNSYQESGLPFVFGTEANEHARYILKAKLARFYKANIKCYFVFKGGNTNFNKKIKKMNDDHQYDFDIETNYKYVTPIFMREVCLQIIKEKGYNFATSVVESRDDMIALAHKLSCPVLTYDIGLCFKRVPYVLSLKYTNPDNYIMCKQYTLQNFLDNNFLTEKKAAIFAVLSDIQLFEQYYFNDLFETWGVLDENGYEQNKKLINWLSEHSEDETLEDVSKFFSSDTENTTFLDAIQNILENLDIDHRSVVTDYFYNDCKLTVYRQDPQWFEKGVAIQTIAIPYVNLYKHKIIFGSTAIENKNSPDSMLLSMDIIKYAYNLLTNFQTTQISLYRSAEVNVKISTEDRNIRKPDYSCHETVFENGWENIKKLKLFEHFLDENDIKIATLNHVPFNARLTFIALTYFARKKLSENVDVTKEAYCIIICYVVLNQIRINYNAQTKDISEKNTRKNSIISKEDGNKAEKVTEKYFKLGENEVKEIFNGEILKRLVEFQYCLLHINYLNALCGSPYVPTRYYSTFNGTFIYKLLHDMQDQNADEFIQKLLHTAPSLLSFVSSLIARYEELVDS